MGKLIYLSLVVMSDCKEILTVVEAVTGEMSPSAKWRRRHEGGGLVPPSFLESGQKRAIKPQQKGLRPVLGAYRASVLETAALRRQLALQFWTSCSLFISSKLIVG
jgi:hypothetical protein